MGGMAQEGRLADGTPIPLHLELDPLETLRMGTYVGSCTGLGGSFAYSSAAVVLDINKRVLDARTASGAVVGRRLVCITQDEQLACFDVYPAGVSRELKLLFRDFDIALAKRRGPEIHRGGENPNGTGTIETLPSKEWWDDYVWDLHAGPGRPHPLQ